ncbi:MAG: tRNA (N(6)-L-threonylcarbamoyladenosine(37)-C(2))-methylthiotransferase MtaB [Alphaproteobacteria bacterium]
MAKSKIVTLGCRLNSLESEMLRKQTADLDDVIVVNTCSVTAEAERQARQTIRRLKRENKNARIIVTGCAAQVNPEQFAQMSEVSKVVGNREKMEISRYIPLTHNDDDKVVVSPRDMLNETAHHLISGMENHTRAFVQIQQGCNHKCSFCIIREARGPSWSLPQEQILEQIKKLMDFGHKEIVLTGVDISSWGQDFDNKASLGELVGLILRNISELPRLRLSSLDPAVHDAALLETLAEERFMPHLHLSLQAGENRVLANMGRRHNTQSAAELIAKIRDISPHISLGADMITGFPKESDAQFEATYNFIKEQNIPLLHVFPYSARKGTPAAKMRAIPKAERKARATKLRQLGLELKANWLKSFLGTTASILVEANGRGYSPHYAPVSLNNTSYEGKIVQAIFTHIEDERLVAEVIKNS